MERQYSKEDILEMYLNYVYFGGGYYGIEAAAEGYFGVHASDLTLDQSAMLAGILKSPSGYAPHINYAASINRRNNILRLMRDYGYITDDEKSRPQPGVLPYCTTRMRSTAATIQTPLQRALLR